MTLYSNNSVFPILYILFTLVTYTTLSMDKHEKDPFENRLSLWVADTKRAKIFMMVNIFSDILLNKTAS